MKKQQKNGTPPRRNVIPLHSTILGRRIIALETEKTQLEGRQTMLIRALGALVVHQAEVAGVEPTMLIPFADMNVSRDIGFAVDRGATPGLVISVTKPPVAGGVIDSEAEVVALADPMPEPMVESDASEG